MMPRQVLPKGDLFKETTPLGQAEKLTIGSWPDGASQRVEVSVPDGHSIKSIDLDISASTLTNSMSSTLTDVGDFDGNAVYDGMDVNKSSLQILPQDWTYDFESSTWAPEWTRSGVQTGPSEQILVWVVLNSPKREPSATIKNPA